jgi:hypothetical protein
MQTPKLQPGEAQRFHASSVRGVIGRSGPTYRATTSVPFIQDIDLFITDRRVIVRAELLLGLFDADYSAWFPESSQPAGEDGLRSASLEESAILGPSLTLVATTGSRTIWRGPEMRLQLFLPEAKAALAALPAGIAAPTAA